MADEARHAAPEVAKAASETASQLLARILDQLALSAWLPSAALTLLMAFVLELGSVLSGARLSNSPAVALSRTFEALGKTSIGGLILLVVVIVVLTMLTQAFSFESIRLLEGYWGVNRPSERLAQSRARHFRKVQKRLNKRYKRLTKAAWKGAKPRVTADPEFTAGMVQALEAQVLMKPSNVQLTEAEEKVVDEKDWRVFAPPDLLRRRTNLDKKLDDFPDKLHMMPTRLGNVLRHYEDETGYESVESMVDEVFDSLPASLQLSHDEQRSRLDLYCSMQFVLILVAVVAGLRFGYQHWGYTITAIGVALAGIWILYRAAVASARYYGSLLVSIARYVERRDALVATAPVPAP